MRGISDGGNGNHSGPEPSVGTYLDEQPITTIGGTLDVHVSGLRRKIERHPHQPAHLLTVHGLGYKFVS